MRQMNKQTLKTTTVTILSLFVSLFLGRAAHAALGREQMIDLLKIVDDRQKNNGDWRASAYLEQKEKDKVDVVYETEYYRQNTPRQLPLPGELALH